MRPVQKNLIAPVMLAFLTVTCSAAAYSQQPPANSPFNSAAQTSAVDPKAHEAAVRLVNALDLKAQMAAGVDSDLDKGVQAMKTQQPNLRPEFLEAWRKRMKERMNPDDFVAVVVQVYAKYFNADELDQLSNVVMGRKRGETVELSDALKEKFQKNAIVIQSEILGGTTQLGAKLGGEVGEEIGKEHPEWAPPPAPVKPAQPAK